MERILRHLCMEEGLARRKWSPFICWMSLRVLSTWYSFFLFCHSIPPPPPIFKIFIFFFFSFCLSLHVKTDCPWIPNIFSRLQRVEYILGHLIPRHSLRDLVCSPPSPPHPLLLHLSFPLLCPSSVLSSSMNSKQFFFILKNERMGKLKWKRRKCKERMHKGILLF